MNRTKILFVVTAVFVVSSCAAASPQKPAPQASPAPTSVSSPQSGPPLYKRIGGYDAIAAVVDDFLPHMFSDKQLAHYFTGLSRGSKDLIRQHIIDLLCDVSGGPCKYLGRDMRSTHEGLGITESDWTEAVKLLVASLDKYHVAAREKNDLLQAVTLLKEDIVEK